jgi:DNA-directed RNA polymerase
LYTLTNYLTYQGDDLSRSLLLFNPLTDKKIPLTDKGFNYLLIYFANLAGQDKCTFDERIEWSKENFANIYEDFISNRIKFYNNYLINIKDKLQFISIMFAIVKVLNAEIKGYRSKVIINNPILFDASCNGLQHLSALTRELNTAIHTNLISLPDSTVPNDYYNFAGNIVQKELDKCVIKNISNFKINRSFIKKTVMTIPYNISLFGVKEQIKEHFSEYKEGNKYFYKVPAELTKNNENIYLYPSELFKLGELVYNTLINNLPSLKVLTNYLDELLTILIKLDSPIIWITPAGLKISLSNIQFKKERTTSSLIPYGKPVTISIPTNKLNSRKIKTSFMPNLIHSLDASNIHLLCKNLKDIPLYTIHDCFASTANNMEIIENKVKITFIEIYFADSNYLEKMHKNLIDQIKSYIDKDDIQIINTEEYINIDKKLYKLPILPEAFINKKIMNTFIEGIMRSKYFIS